MYQWLLTYLGRYLNFYNNVVHLSQQLWILTTLNSLVLEAVSTPNVASNDLVLSEDSDARVRDEGMIDEAVSGVPKLKSYVEYQVSHI